MIPSGDPSVGLTELPNGRQVALGRLARPAATRPGAPGCVSVEATGRSPERAPSPGPGRAGRRSRRPGGCARVPGSPASGVRTVVQGHACRFPDSPPSSGLGRHRGAGRALSARCGPASATGPSGAPGLASGVTSARPLGSAPGAGGAGARGRGASGPELRVDGAVPRALPLPRPGRGPLAWTDQAPGPGRRAAVVAPVAAEWTARRGEARRSGVAASAAMG